MYDEYNEPSETLVEHWHAHNDHSGDAEDCFDLERDGPDQAGDGAVVDEIACPDCGRQAGHPCLAGAPIDGPVAGELVTAHPARYHAALRACTRSCRECWTEPDADGVQVRLGGAEEILTVLWSDYETTSGSVRDVCTRLVRAASTPARWLPEIDAIYLRTGRALTAVAVRFVHLGAGRVGVEVTDELTKPAGIARAAFGVSDDWAPLLKRHDIAVLATDVDPRLVWAGKT